MSDLLAMAILPTLMIVAALTDVSTYRIPNWLTGLTAALFFPMALLTQMPLAEFGWHLAAGLAMFVIGYALFAFGLFGGGDSKLMAAAGLWFGTTQLLPFMTATAIAGGVIAIFYTAWTMLRSMQQARGKETASVGGKFKNARLELPYGLALSIGAILAFPGTWWMNVQ